MLDVKMQLLLVYLIWTWLSHHMDLRLVYDLKMQIIAWINITKNRKCINIIFSSYYVTYTVFEELKISKTFFIQTNKNTHSLIMPMLRDIILAPKCCSLIPLQHGTMHLYVKYRTKLQKCFVYPYPLNLKMSAKTG